MDYLIYFHINQLLTFYPDNFRIKNISLSYNLIGKYNNHLLIKSDFKH
jgi:hypothetical protein